MAEVPEPIDLGYLRKINPSVEAAVAVARVVNQLLAYLKENEEKLRSLPDFSKPL
jgi:hypothetical protein